jgi:predicted Rossmann fold flavoprotein
MNRYSRKPAVAVIGGGAAGFFTAVNTARMNRSVRVVIFEKSREVLSKVRISGGGRCNVTHHCFDPEKLALHYPRGSKMLRWSFEQFQAGDTVNWFESRGVKLKAEEDGRMFPVTDRSDTIIDCLIQEAGKYHIRIRTNTRVESIQPLNEGGFELSVRKGGTEYFDAVVVATGGHNRENAYSWLRELGHNIIPPVPSLFTFNFRDKIFSDLAGISVTHAEIHIEDTRYTEEGPVLITHWGLSGPSVLKLSAWAARVLHEKEYRYTIRVNWLAPLKESQVREALLQLRDQNAKKRINRQGRFPIPGRLWERFIKFSGISDSKRWAELSNQDIHNLLQQLVHARYVIQGKTTYKEEFVTCGGIPLKEVDPDTLESRIVPNLFFTGEVLDIDGVTGGFNFQAAWTNGWLAAQALAERF